MSELFKWDYYALLNNILIYRNNCMIYWDPTFNRGYLCSEGIKNNGEIDYPNIDPFI